MLSANELVSPSQAHHITNSSLSLSASCVLSSYLYPHCRSRLEYLASTLRSTTRSAFHSCSLATARSYRPVVLPLKPSCSLSYSAPIRAMSSAAEHATSLARSEEQKKGFIRAQEIMAQNDGGRDADASKAVETQGWEQLWCVFFHVALHLTNRRIAEHPRCPL